MEIYHLKHPCETFYSENCLLNIHQETFGEPSQYLMQQKRTLHSLKPEARSSSFGGGSYMILIHFYYKENISNVVLYIKKCTVGYLHWGSRLKLPFLYLL